MKFNQIIPLFTLFLLFTACTEGIRGSGNVITEIRAVTDFDGVEAGDAMTVEITQGDFAVEVYADDNIISKIATERIGNKLKVGYAENVNFRNNITAEVHISMPTITSLEIEDAVDADLINFTGLSDLTIDVSDASDLNLSGDAENLTINVTDASNVHGFDFVTNICKLEVKAASELDIYCNDMLEGTVRDASTLRYKGEPTVEVTTSDASNIKNAN